MIDPLEFATEWISAWNAHDLERVLSHYADDIVMLSPYARQYADGGRVAGIGPLRSYWSTALAAVPDLKFELRQVLVGHESVTILYRNHRGQDVSETCEFAPGGLVTRTYACYTPAAA
jgi:hypothetical protein